MLTTYSRAYCNGFDCVQHDEITTEDGNDLKIGTVVILLSSPSRPQVY